MGVCRPLFSDEEHAALQATVSTTEIFGLGRMTFCQPVSYTQPISANVYSENRKWTWLQIFPSPSPSPSPAKNVLKSGLKYYKSGSVRPLSYTCLPLRVFCVFTVIAFGYFVPFCCVLLSDVALGLSVPVQVTERKDSTPK